FIASARDCLLTGYRTLLTADGRFFNDESLWGDALASYLSRIGQADPFLNEHTGLRSIGDSRLSMVAGGRTEQHLEGSTILLSSHEPSNYGSWIFRVLPKLAAFQQQGTGGRRILVYAPRELQEFLKLCGVAAGQIVMQDMNILY